MATLLLWVIFLPEKLKKHALVDAFLSFLHKNSIDHLLRTSREYFRPPPQSFRKEMDNIYVHL